MLLRNESKGQSPNRVPLGASISAVSEEPSKVRIPMPQGLVITMSCRLSLLKSAVPTIRFGALTDGELDQLISQGRAATYRSGAVVFRKGDPAQDIMIVLCGRIKLSSASPNGREVLFDFIGPGRCFGEVALIDGTTRKLDATAVKPSAVFTLRRGDVLACLEAHPEIAVRIVRVLCARLSRAMEMLEDRTQLGLASRSARTLFRLAREYGDGVRIDLRISQSEIAGLVGATREKVNRQLCGWCRSGILALDEGHLTILDHGALRAIAEED
jgi:CRP/FNR family transcriptional regulator, cyclic AMP receptor protein